MKRSAASRLPLCPLLLLWSFALLLFCQNGKSFPLHESDLANDDNLYDLYGRWASFYKVVRSKAESAKRFRVFAENAKFIHEFNKKGANNSFTVELNAFGDLTNQEFTALYTGYKKPRPRTSTGSTADSATFNLTAVPASIDWRSLGAVTGVKDQKSCGSCWAFSTVAAAEGLNKIKGGTLTPLSEQALVDCDTLDNGCNGGNLDHAFYFMLTNGGIPSSATYPYTGTKGTCNSVKVKTIAGSIAGYRDVTPNSESSLVTAVATVPVAVAIDASGTAFQFYKSGVFSGPCGTSLNHGVAVVGYTSTYWIVKNSWGSTWGSAGYIFMARGQNFPYGLCGINMWPVYPV